MNEVLANPKLDAHAPARLLAEFELGQLYSGRLHQTDKAADAFAKVLDALDDKSANRLSPSDQFRVLGDSPAIAYLSFGQVFLAAKRLELAVRAFERALVYEEDNPQISLALAETLLKLNKGDQALALVDRNIERQTSFMEAYELLAKVLKALNREKDITPRLEAAARRDSKNVPLQYILADRYRETGEIDKAEALYKELLTSQPTPQTFRALAHSLLKRKKAADLLKVMSEAWARPESQEAIRPQLLAVAVDDAMAEAVLDAGLKQSAANPAGLTKSAHEILSLIANNPGRASHNKIRRLEMLLRLQRLLAEQNPSEIVYSEIVDTLRRMGKYADAASAVEQLIAKYPNAKSVPTLAILADLHWRAGHNEAVKAVLREAMALDAGDGAARYRLADVLSEVGQVDDAARILREATKREPNNPIYELRLGSIFTQYGRNDEAIKLFEGLLKRHGDDQDLVKDVRGLLSVIYVNQGNYAKGEAELEILLQSSPDDPGPNNDLGYLYAEQGKNLEKAESMIRKALSTTREDSPSYRPYLDSLGWVLFKRGKPKEALEALTKAVETMKAETERDGSNPDATILEHLGDVYFHVQELDKAGDAWRQAMKAGEHAIPPDKRLAGDPQKARFAGATRPDTQALVESDTVMAGHSHSANIAHRKGLVDAKRGQLFTKLCRAVYVAARIGGGDPAANMRLRYAIDKARSFSVPKENIERSVKKATGELGAENFEEVIYEGYGPGGVAVLCEALTDNRNRTAGELRRLFESAGGNLGASGCVGYLFNFKGLVVIDSKHVDEDRLMEIALEAGADDVQLVEGYFEVTSDPKLFETVRKTLEEHKIATESAETCYIPTTYVDLDADNGKKMRKLKDLLDENDDVQNVYANDNIPEGVMAP